MVVNKMSETTPFKTDKTKKITIGRRQAERATKACNKAGKTPEQLIKDKIDSLYSPLV